MNVMSKKPATGNSSSKLDNDATSYTDEGLEPGERVITSPYTSFVGMDRLSLNED